MPFVPLIVGAISAASAVAGTVMSAKQGAEANANQEKQLKAQRTAQSQAEAQALSTQRKSEIAQNEANKKTPDIASILSRAAQAAKGGLGSTMLTGVSGVDPSMLNLGKTSLLGG